MNNSTDTLFAQSGYGNITLRDYIAIEALKVHMTAFVDFDTKSEREWDEFVTQRAYRTADAMLKAREE